VKFGSGLSKLSNAEEAIQAACTQAMDQIGEGPVDFAILFISPQFSGVINAVCAQVKSQVGADTLIGCTCMGIIGQGEEIENVPAASILLGRIPGATIQPFYLNQAELEAGEDIEYWKKRFKYTPHPHTSFIILPDPFSLDVSTLLERFNGAFQDAPVIGGMASGANFEGGNTLFLNGAVYQEGAVGLCLQGDFVLKTVVSQGCRPIGEAFAVTASSGNVIQALAGKPALSVLQKTVQDAPSPDRDLARNAIFVGRVTNEYQDEFIQGDFVVRGLMGIDQKTGALLVGDLITPGETIQFHVRDAQSAHEDLERMLKGSINGTQGPQAALIFSCNGRGSHLFKKSGHDAQMVSQHTGNCPQAGFLCSGEIGPIAGKSFVHGFTSSIGLFYPTK
jgi:small ligand-binding sensory domain FIST